MFLKRFVLFLQRLLTLNRMEKEKVNRYTANLLKVFGKILNPVASVQITNYIYPKGCIIRMVLVKGGYNETSSHEFESWEKAGKAVDLQRFIPGFETIYFGGTNFINNGDEIIFIKEGKDSEWLEDSARIDMVSFLSKGGQNG